MNTYKSVSDTVIATNLSTLPCPYAAPVGNSSSNLRAALPRPLQHSPAVADTGRISFGAGFRLAPKK